jgi:threonylcarbamoyladenosine tRNA methylthiotransferase MtaB
MRDLATGAGLGNVAVVNSCAVTAEAGKQARQAVRRLKREQPDRHVVVTGCAAQVDPNLFAAMPEVAAVLGNDEKTRPETWRGLSLRETTLRRLADASGTGIQVGDIMAARDAAPYPAPRAAQVRASVQVQTGCDHRCTFCIIPFGRGRSRSTPPETVIRDIRSLVESGAREVVLTGVDLTDYGRDLSDGLTLGRLVKTILGPCRTCRGCGCPRSIASRPIVTFSTPSRARRG